MNKGRLEAFSDGVIAIIITIMVLEIKTPEHANWQGLLHLLPTLVSYVLSFALVGVYWNNHHHLLQSLKKVSSSIMWSNLNLLFWISLVPFGTKWIGETHFDKFAVIFYAAILIACGISFSILQAQVLKNLKEDSSLKTIIKAQNSKTFISVLCNVLAIPAAFLDARISLILLAASAVLWIIPSKKIEKELSKES